MKAINADLLTNVVSSYDKTKTTIFGNTIVQTVSGQQVISPPLIKFIDTLSDFGVTPLHAFATPNGRVFITTTSPTGQTPTILCYTFNYTTGAYTSIGGIKLALTNTATHTIRQLQVFDSNTSAIKILLTTVNTTAANGGLYMGNAIPLTDFVPVSFPTIPLATIGDTQASKVVFFLHETGGTNLLTAAQGHAISYNTNLCYVGNGVLASYQTYVFNPYATISTVSAAGVTSDCYVTKTGITGSGAGMLGTILLLQAFRTGTPTSGPNSGVECLYVPGSTGFNEFKLSDITLNATTIPSLRVCNALDIPNTSTALTPATATWSDTLKRIIFQVNSKFIIKDFVNNSYELACGCINSQYRTAVPNLIYSLGAITVSSHDTRNGWVFFTCTTAGQIGVLAVDLRSEQTYQYSYFTTKIMNTTASQWIDVKIDNKLMGSSNSIKLWYRAASTETDSIFNTSSGGWILLPDDYNMSSISSNNFIQFKVEYYIAQNTTGTYAQPYELRLITQPNIEIDQHWAHSDSDSSSVSPASAAFSQTQAYPGSKHWEFFAYNRDTGTLFIQKNTQDNPTEFDLSTNDGTSYGALSGAIPSNPLLNVLRYKFSSPPGVKLQVALREKI